MWTDPAAQGVAVTDGSTRNSELSERERQIVALIGRGYTNSQIARQLDITPQTVKNKLTVIYHKVGVRGRVRLAVYAMDHGIE